MSTISFEAEMSKKDRAAFRRSMNNIQKKLGKSESTALRIGMTKLTRSLGASTKVAPEYRKYTDTGEKSRSGLSRKFEVARHPYFGGTWIVNARSVSTLKRKTAVAIGYRGLAKKSWTYAGKKGRLNVTKAEAAKPAIAKDNAKRNKLAKSLVLYNANLKSDDKYIEIVSRVNYIEQAMQGGPKSIDTAMARAASAVNKYINDKLAKA